MTGTVAAMALAHPLGPTTVDDWLAADQPVDGSRLELIWGYLYMTPPPGGPHQHATFHLARALFDALQAADRKDLHVLPGVAVRLSTPLRTGVVPDVAVVDCGIEHVAFEPENLVLAVEVWSRGNKQNERDTKVAAYANAGVPYLWIVEPRADAPVRFWGYQLAGRGYRQMAYEDSGRVVLAPGPVQVPMDTSLLH
jgi:Uma2 family endonuclease